MRQPQGKPLYKLFDPLSETMNPALNIGKPLYKLLDPLSEVPEVLIYGFIFYLFL